MNYLCRTLIKSSKKMRLFCLVMLLGISGLQAKVWSQTELLELKASNVTMVEAVKALQEKTQLKFVFNVEELQKYKVNVQIEDKTLEEALDLLFEGKPLRYEITPEHVIISQATPQPAAPQAPEEIEVKGVVVDINGAALPGVTVMLKGTTLGTATDIEGHFTLKYPDTGTPQALIFSFIGMKAQEVAVVKGQTEYKVTLEEEAQKLADVVVTGYFQKKKISQTGSEVVVTGDELRKVGSLNLIQAISSFDPGVRTLMNNEFGSDPNHMPEITIRGEKGFDLRSSADDSRTDPNAPLYIMDGIEVSATDVYDMDMNRVESFSILKDASATSLYGSRGANGVIVITTKRPQPGEIRVTVNANYIISAPDLSSYNLMDAREKLEFERLAGLYESTSNDEQMQLDVDYNNTLAEIERGVDSYWLSQPLRTSLNQRYSAYLEGGDEHFRYGITLRYDTDKGVMIGSDRERYGINVYFSYDIQNKLNIRNDISVDDVKGSDSPYGTFSEYAQMNPYNRMKDENGEYIPYYENNGTRIYNPLVNTTLPNYSFDQYTQVMDNLQFQWWPIQNLFIKGNLAITKQLDRTEAFLSAASTDFQSTTDADDKGSFTTTNGSSVDLTGNLTVSYNDNFFEKLYLSAGAGVEFTTSKSTTDGYTATGFLNDRLTHPSFAQQFRDNSTPSGSFDKSKSVGFLGNVNLNWDNRYILEGSIRADGSSVFGRDSRFAPFWSVGAAWNVNQEDFWTGTGSLKIRASVGSTGSTNFSPDQAMTRFTYSGDSEYNGIYGAVISAYGNPALKWQQVMKYNAGFDLNVWRNIIDINFDAYLERTQNLLVNVDVAPSTGFTSYTENVGQLDNKGIEVRARFNLINRPDQELNWNVTLSAAHERDKIRKISNAMRAMNEEAMKLENSTDSTGVFQMYEVGRSQNALMVVRSMGIDPATGNEIYIKRDGSLTFEYDPNDKVEVGNTTPKLQGYINSNLNWKGFNLYFSFNYELGAKTWNSTLASKVEGASPYYNADKRVLYDRWQQPGDIAMFRRIDDYESPVYQSDRLVQKNNFLKLTSLSLSYDLPDRIIDNCFLDRCRFTFSMSDVFYLSTIKQERGTSYPFARSFTLGANITF